MMKSFFEYTQPQKRRREKGFRAALAVRRIVAEFVQIQLSL
jgi:hypothetical protein